MTCYRKGGCGPYEMYSCSECPASKPEYLEREHPEEKKDDLINQLFSGVLSNGKRCDLCKQPYNYNYPIKVRSGIDGEIYKINTVKRKNRTYNLCQSCLAMILYVDFLKPGDFELVLDEENE